MRNSYLEGIDEIFRKTIFFLIFFQTSKIKNVECVGDRPVQQFLVF